MNRRHALITLTAPASGLLTGLLTGLLVGCAGLGGPTVITLSEADIAALIQRSFPLTRRVLEVFDVQLQAPNLRLLPAQNRLAVDLTVSTQDRLFGRTARGQLLFDSALRYDARDATVRLTQVRVQQVNLSAGSSAAAGPVPPLTTQPTSPAPPGLPLDPVPLPDTLGQSSAVSPGARLGNVLAERVLDDLVIYRVPADRLASLRQLGLQPGAVTITARGLEITLARLGS